MSESNTPRTDKEVENLVSMSDEGETYVEPVSAAFARSLELESNMLLGALEKLAALRPHNYVPDSLIKQAEDAIAAAKKARES
jgi:hypothetical protein